MRVRDFFNSAYASTERYWWRHSHRYSSSPEDFSASLITQQTLRALRDTRPGRALDVGCGEGVDAIRLAIMGWEVRACDVSEVALAKAQKFAEEQGVEVDFVHAAVEDVPLTDGRYDLIISNGVLHYVERKRPTLERLQDATRSGGLHVVSLWSDFTPVPEAHQLVPTYPDHEEGTVVSAYSSWYKQLLYFERAKAEASHTDLGEHMHSFIKLIARKYQS